MYRIYIFKNLQLASLVTLTLRIWPTFLALYNYSSLGLIFLIPKPFGSILKKLFMHNLQTYILCFSKPKQVLDFGSIGNPSFWKKSFMKKANFCKCLWQLNFHVPWVAGKSALRLSSRCYVCYNIRKRRRVTLLLCRYRVATVITWNWFAFSWMEATDSPGNSSRFRLTEALLIIL